MMNFCFLLLLIAPLRQPLISQRLQFNGIDFLSFAFQNRSPQEFIALSSDNKNVSLVA